MTSFFCFGGKLEESRTKPNYNRSHWGRQTNVKWSKHTFLFNNRRFDGCIRWVNAPLFSRCFLSHISTFNELGYRARIDTYTTFLYKLTSEDIYLYRTPLKILLIFMNLFRNFLFPNIIVCNSLYRNNAR